MTTTNTPFFDAAFHALTGNDPFPWQQDFFRRLIAGERLNACNIPTGLGKTAIIAIWLIALAHYVKSKGACDRIPRRLVYVVNRRTVVDQSTGETERIRRRLNGGGDLSDQDRSVVNELRCLLRRLCATDQGEVLAISTLRGEFADNGEWCSDPARPAVIVGTVDMIGSRLLFSGYGVGFKRKPLHAGFLGQDVLLVHDEAHLEPAFQELLVAIQKEQREGRTPDRWPLRVMELTATSRGQEEGEQPFELTKGEKNPQQPIPGTPAEPLHVVWRRLRAKKTIYLHPPERRSEGAGEKEPRDQITDLALKYKDSKVAVLVFLRRVDDVERVVEKLRKSRQNVQQLTGTLRGLERNALAAEDSVFRRFLPKAEPGNETAYLVCTSAGEVGVDISADHLVCDLTTFDSMAQRFGRVNRFGDRDDTEIHVVYPNEFDEKDEFDRRRKKTLDLLRALSGDASPKALGDLDAEARLAAFAPTPTILPTSDILFDSWALTSIRGKLPGRPPVEPYLHGISGWEPPETHVAWREEVDVVTGELLEQYRPEDLLEDYPLKPHELLRDNSGRVFDRLKKLKAPAETPVWIVSDDDSVEVTSLGELVESGKDAISYKTVLLPPQAGGLQNGVLRGYPKSGLALNCLKCVMCGSLSYSNRGACTWKP
jgi:CRISPR-associated endonuclease/helicase Cas3